jgi:hypothetical protein
MVGHLEVVLTRSAERSRRQDIRWLPVVSLGIATAAAVVGVFVVSAIDVDGRNPGTQAVMSGGAGSMIDGGGAGDTGSSSPPPATESNQPTDGPISWATTLVHLGNPAAGSTVSVTCPPAGSPGAVYGTDVYTSDSSICTAAVHAGSISLASGGDVTIVSEGPSSGYVGSARNGITTSDWNGAWDASFTVENGRPAPEPRGIRIPWTETARNYGENVGERYTFECLPGGVAGSVWGTDSYTDDSSICTAAVHAGRASFEEGGVVTIVITEGGAEFNGSTRHGVTSADWGQWPRSFVVE